jgi:hypothetical protein
MKDSSPFQQLAVPEFLRTFDDLLSPTAELSWFERLLIQRKYELVILGHYERDELKTIEIQAGSLTKFYRMALLDHSKQ